MSRGADHVIRTEVLLTKASAFTGREGGPEIQTLIQLIKPKSLKAGVNSHSLVQQPPVHATAVDLAKFLNPRCENAIRKFLLLVPPVLTS